MFSLLFEKNSSIAFGEMYTLQNRRKFTNDHKLREVNPKVIDLTIIKFFPEKSLGKNLMKIYCTPCDQNVIRMLIVYYVLSEDHFINFF